MDDDINTNMMKGLYLCLGPVTWIFLNTIEVVNEAFVQRAEDFAGRYQITSGKKYFFNRAFCIEEQYFHTFCGLEGYFFFKYLGIMFTDGGKDIAFANYSPMWRIHRKIAAKALR